MHIKDPKLLPEHMKRMVDYAERKRLGITTQDERQAKVETFNERKLHTRIRQLFNLKGIVFREDRMDKRTSGTVGWPDFTFSVLRTDPNGVILPIACAWECKVGNGKLSPEQTEMIWKMEKAPNAWRVKVIRSLQEAADELKGLGV